MGGKKSGLYKKLKYFFFISNAGTPRLLRKYELITDTIELFNLKSTLVHSQDG